MIGWMLMGWTGCDELTDCEQAALVEAPALEIGLGEEAFVAPLADGDEVSVSYGSQGGQHLWLAIHTAGFAPGVHHGLFRADESVPAFFATLLDADGSEVARQSWQFAAMEGTPEDAEIALGEFVLTGVVGGRGPYRLGVTAQDACGNELASEVEIEISGLFTE